MKGYQKENAAERDTYVGDIFKIGETEQKRRVLESLEAINPRYADLHNEGLIHIHDLDAYGETYNCLTLNILNKFPYDLFESGDDVWRIHKLFDHFRAILSRLGNEQSGGMSFGNFDEDVSAILKKLDIPLNENNRKNIKAGVSSLIHWANNSHDRMGRVSYYVTLNIGLASNDYARFICESVLDSFSEAGVLVFKPNIIFKVKKGVNLEKNSPNYYLYKKANLITARKMIPTYVLCDAEPNVVFKPYNLAIMGCRTRVVKDLHGEDTSIGRGNICNISINLPGIAMRVMKNKPDDPYAYFKSEWLSVAESVAEILLDRYHRLNVNKKPSDFPLNYQYDLWISDFTAAKESNDVFKHGTLSIGFIGLDDAMKLVFGKHYYQDNKIYEKAIDFVGFMRWYIDKLRDEQHINWSLLATSGELISGRFLEKDSKHFHNDVVSKGFYTNSFHVSVDSRISAFEKIRYEGVFHKLCNGGCITYVELGEAPIGNSEAIDELIRTAIEAGVSYLGFNFPLDVCPKCHSTGIFDVCPTCKHDKPLRIRRVSGYLEVLDYFTSGKINEEKARRKNLCT
jgi:ribonucleoside-triphosphate reductase (formate)